MYPSEYPKGSSFPLDSFVGMIRSCGGNIQLMPAQRHARVHPHAIARDPIENHFVYRD